MVKVRKTAGWVAFVGAGPGDVGLLTLRACEFLSQAQVVVYDGLANIDFLSLAPQAKFVHVGKNMACRSLKNYSRAVSMQTDINRMLVRYAKQGKFVVRLKGGDPFVFGRGGEEAAYLKKHGVRFEVVPGITAGYSVPAYAGIPVTDRGASSMVAFVTGHEDPDKENPNVDWQKMAAFQGTIVTFMGMRNLTRICEQLIQGGKPKRTPAAVIEWGTLPKQRTVTGNLSDIASLVKKAKIAAPSLTVIGEVAKMRKDLLWFEKKKLSGKTVLITRAQRQAGVFKEKLQKEGAEVLEYPAIKIEPPKSWKALDHAIRHIDDYDWIVLTSVNGVEYFWQRVKKLKKDARYFHGIKFAVIGEATKTALHEKGIEADLMPKAYHSEALFETLNKKVSLKGARFLLARADIAAKRFATRLKQAGAFVDDVSTYRTLANKEGFRLLREWLAHKEIDYITFTSSSTVDYFLQAAGKKYAKKLPGTLLSIGPVTSKTLRSHGFKSFREAKQHTLDGLKALMLQG